MDLPLPGGCRILRWNLMHQPLLHHVREHSYRLRTRRTLAQSTPDRK
jgi:hypothetical protein